MATQLTLEQAGETPAESYWKGKSSDNLIVWRDHVVKNINIQKGIYPINSKTGKPIKDPNAPWMVPSWTRSLQIIEKILAERGINK